jgi:hypothetical protein
MDRVGSLEINVLVNVIKASKSLYLSVKSEDSCGALIMKVNPVCDSGSAPEATGGIKRIANRMVTARRRVSREWRIPVQERKPLAIHSPFKIVDHTKALYSCGGKWRVPFGQPAVGSSKISKKSIGYPK